MEATATLNLDLIGVHPQENGTTKEPFWGLSFRMAGNRIGTLNINDKATAEKLVAKFEEASKKNERLLFQASACSLAVATEYDEEAQAEVPVIRGSTPYFRIVEADVNSPVQLKLTGSRTRGARVTLDI